MAQDPRKLLQEADKTLKSASGGFSFFGGKEEKYERAADLYKDAANAFILAHRDEEAGQAFERAAAVKEHNLKELFEAADSWQKAGDCYRRAYKYEDSFRLMERAIYYYAHEGNFRRAATVQKRLADDVERDFKDNPMKVAEAHKKTAEFFGMDHGSTASQNQALKVAAKYYALAGEYVTAIQLWERLATESLNNNLMKFSAKEYLLHAGWCHLVSGAVNHDVVAARRGIENLTAIDPEFISDKPSQLEKHVVLALLDVLESPSKDSSAAEQWGAILREFNKTKKLENWEVEVLSRGKQALAEREEDFS